MKKGLTLKRLIHFNVLFFTVALAGINLPAYCEPSVGLFILESKNVSEQVNAAINNAIFNFVKEQKKYNIIDLRPQKAGENTENFNYVFTGSIIGNDNGIELKLILKTPSENITRTISKVYQNANLILLDSRMLVSDLFDMSLNLSPSGETDAQTDSFAGEFKEVKNIDMLSGSWRGEEGIERIEIMRGGKAVAVLSGGTSVFLHLKISDGYLIITQAGAPNARQFGDLPDEIAKKAVELKKTPSWKFLISPNNKILSGEKTDIKIEYSDGMIISANEVIKKVQWTKN